jgi:heat shock protein HslJ
MIRLSGLRPAALVLALALVALTAACDVSSDGPPSTPIGGHPTTFAGTMWLVSEIGGQRVTIGDGPTLAFDETHVQGSGGCNHLGGGYAYDPRSGELRFDQLAMTAMACAEPERNAVETRFTQLLGQPGLVATLEPNGHVVLQGAAGRIDLDPPSSTNGG